MSLNKESDKKSSENFFLAKPKLSEGNLILAKDIS
jgi:hypothetical protein